ncbi:hypothetical protein NONI108955_26715 [Nocardia ninae]|uniref:Uncharacterized protein n=1 Tax=Nocardia ninae NBRC 108245 TaxID=1210091 RepID=A0A511MSJ7_9NOCA|nr:hypothetical protein [Nocardia ninae]GEM43006.1 hypothetical protein NN4_75250 [Nocardia ninae NBRC 108245]
MTGTVQVRQAADGLWIIGPEGAPTVLDETAAIDVLVLEAAGGHLTWSLLAGQSLPAAVLDDVKLAQGWLWAVFGEQVALAVDAGETGELVAVPGMPELVTDAWRLGYAHWAARWWPASIIDGIAPLDERLLREEIATLSAACELIVDGADEYSEAAEQHADELADTPGRAEDYALAAGPATTVPSGALVLARGSGGWDWHRCPPGLLDASEQAVSWEVLRGAGTTTVLVRVVAAARGDVPSHLYPHALVRTSSGTAVAPLTLAGDVWGVEVPAPEGAESTVTVEVYVPGVGGPEPGSPEMRRRVREFALSRLSRATDPTDHPTDAPLLAEIAAAESDSDF